jgi:hypothetical protein
MTALSLVACGDDDGTPDGSPPPPIDASSDAADDAGEADAAVDAMPDAPVVLPPDAGEPDAGVFSGSCNPVTGAGCLAGEKCDWLQETDDLGRIACVPDGTVERGGACVEGEVGPTTGFDNCQALSTCIAGVCEAICSTDPDSCAPGSSCTQYASIFEGGIGACDYDCNPVDQTRTFDGAPACGSPDPANPNRGCYGTPNSSWACKPAGDPEKVHGSDATWPDGNVYANGCAVGHFVATFYGSEFPECTALCAPAPAFSGNSSQVQGEIGSGFTCPDRNAVDGECRYMWNLSAWPELIPADVGYCYDYERFYIDANQNGVEDPGEEAQSCSVISETDGDGSGIADYIEAGCGPYTEI